MRPKLPRGPQWQKPGAGLGHLFPPNEGPTQRLPVIESVERERCPKCGGSTLLGLKDTDVHEFAVLECDPCDACVDGKVTPERAAQIRAELGR